MSDTFRTGLRALQGRRILVVENEYMIAQYIVGELQSAGADTLGPMSRVTDALRLIETRTVLDAAVLDVNLGTADIWPVVDALRGRCVPIVLATGYDASAIPAAYTHLPRCEKPITGSDLVRALVRALVPEISD